MDMNIQKYLAFAETARQGSFTKAANILHYSQSGVSRMIGDLERDWGLSLLERGHGGVGLTSDGQKLLPYVQRVCREYGELQTQVDEINGLQSGLIRIGTFTSVATHWLPKIISEFQKAYPNIDYELLLGDYTEIEGWIAERRVDCGFVRLPVRNPELSTLFLERDELMAVLPEDHPLGDLENFPIQALNNCPFMLLEKGAKGEISELLDANGVTPNIKFTTWDDYSILSMIESGMGVSILPKLILQRLPYRVLVKPLNVPAYREIGLAMGEHKTAPLVLGRFLEYLEYRG